MKKVKNEWSISNEKFIGVVLFYGFGFLIGVFSVKFAISFFVSVFILSFFLMYLESKEK